MQKSWGWLQSQHNNQQALSAPVAEIHRTEIENRWTVHATFADFIGAPFIRTHVSLVARFQCEFTLIPRINLSLYICINK